MGVAQGFVFCGKIGRISLKFDGERDHREVGDFGRDSEMCVVYGEAEEEV